MYDTRITLHVYSVIMFLCFTAIVAATNVMWDSHVRMMSKTIEKQKSEIARLENIVMSYGLVIAPMQVREINE